MIDGCDFASRFLQSLRNHSNRGLVLDVVERDSEVPVLLILLTELDVLLDGFLAEGFNASHSLAFHNEVMEREGSRIHHNVVFSLDVVLVTELCAFREIDSLRNQVDKRKASVPDSGATEEFFFQFFGVDYCVG